MLSRFPLLWLSLALSLPVYSAGSIQSFTLRNMTVDDFDTVTSTFVSAFDPGPIWTYLYQFRDLYPDYHWRCIREVLETEWHGKPAEGITRYVNVIVPAEKERTNTARSLGWWNLKKREEAKSWGPEWSMPFFAPGLGDWEDSGLDEARSTLLRHGVSRQETSDDSQAPLGEAHQGMKNSELACNLHLDMNLRRSAHLQPQVVAAKKNYIENAYEYQLYLAVLATHPHWDGRGFGAAQVEWGMELAKAEEKRLSQSEGRRVRVPVTLLATPAGYPLYKSLGFESVANLTFNLLDSFHGGTTWFEYMRWFNQEGL